MTRRRSAAGASRRRGLLIGAAVVLVTAIHVRILLYQLPYVHEMTGWFWYFHRTPLPELDLFLPLATLAVLAVLYFLRSRPRRWAAIALLLPAGWIVQLSFALMQGDGLRPLQDKMVVTGHAGFAIEALRRDDFTEVARNYDDLLDRHQLMLYNATKPPGQLFVYWATLRASGILDRFTSGIDRYSRLTIFAALTWPLMTYLVCLLIPPLSIVLGNARSGFLAAVLFAVAPSVTLMTLHLDQCLYPLLAVAPVVLTIHALRRRARWAAALAGASLCLGLYVSFSLLPLVLLLFILTLLVPMRRRPDERRGARGHLIATARERALLAAIFLAFFALSDVVFRLVLNYDIARRYAGVMDAHLHWKHVEWTAPNVLHFGALDLAEFLLWAGLPMVMLFALRTLRAARRAARRRFRPGDALALGLAATLLAMAFLGRTAAETGRLWIFMLPLVAVSAAGEISALGKSRGRALLWLTVLCLFAITLATKRYQDFY